MPSVSSDSNVGSSVIISGSKAVSEGAAISVLSISACPNVSASGCSDGGVISVLIMLSISPSDGRSEV